MSRYRPSSYNEFQERAVNVLDYPPLATETDDTGRINRAINATPAGGALLFPPTKTYTVSTTITTPNGITLLGYSSRVNSSNALGTILQPSATFTTNQPLLNVTSPYTTIIGLAIVGTNIAGTYGIQLSGDASNTNDSHHTVIDRCFISGFDSGICMGAHSDHIYVYDTQCTGNTYGVRFASGNAYDFSFTNCLFDGNTQSSLYLEPNTSVVNVTLLRSHLGFSPYGILQDAASNNGSGFVGLTLIDTPIEHVSAQHVSIVYGGNIRIEGGYWTWNGTPANSCFTINQVNVGDIHINVRFEANTPNANSPSIFAVSGYSNFNVYLHGALNGFAKTWFTGSIGQNNQWLNGKQFAGNQAVGADNVSVTTANTQQSIVSLTNQTNFTNFTAKAFLNVTTACTVTMKLQYANGGVQTYYWYNAQALAVGKYPLPAVLVNATTSNKVEVFATASLANAVNVSATITPEL